MRFHPAPGSSAASPPISCKDFAGMLSFAPALKRALYVITSSLSAPALMRALYEISSCSRLFRRISTNQLHGLRCNVVFCTCIEESAECDYIWLQALMPNVKLCRPLGRATFSKLRLKLRQAAWQTLRTAYEKSVVVRAACSACKQLARNIGRSGCSLWVQAACQKTLVVQAARSLCEQLARNHW